MKPFLKIYGGKFYLRNFIIECFPANWPDLHYKEWCLAGGSVFLKMLGRLKNEAWLNEADWPTFLIWFAIQNDPEAFHQKLLKLKYSEEEFLKQKNILTSKKSNIDVAVAKFAVLRMSRAGMGESFAWSERLRGGQPGDLNAWQSSLQGILPLSKRIQKTRLTNCKCEVLLNNEQLTRADLVYLDPPYLKEVDGGKRTSKNGYALDMTPEQHEDMLKAAVDSDANIVISGYETELYNKYLNTDSGWNMKYKDVVNHSQQQKNKKVRREVVYRNFT